MSEAVPVTKRAFYRAWPAAAFPKAWALFETVSAILGLAALVLVKQYPAWKDRLTDLGWQIPFAVFVLVILFRLFASPYEIYKTAIVERDKYRALAERRRMDQAIADRLTEHCVRGTHEVANLIVDPNDFEDKEQFRKAAFQWLTDLRATMKECGCSAQAISAVTDFIDADIPDPAEIGYPYPGHPEVAAPKALFAMRIKALRRVIDTYAEVKVLGV